MKDYQAKMAEWIYSHGSSEDVGYSLVKLQEESGELARQVYRLCKGRSYDREKARDAVADIFLVLCVISNELEIDLEEAVREAWENSVKDRVYPESPPRKQ